MLESLAELQVEVAVWDRREAQTSLARIVEVRAHGRKVDERHVCRSLERLALPAAFRGGRRNGTDGGGMERRVGTASRAEREETFSLFGNAIMRTYCERAVTRDSDRRKERSWPDRVSQRRETELMRWKFSGKLTSGWPGVYILRTG